MDTTRRTYANPNDEREHRVRRAIINLVAVRDALQHENRMLRHANDILRAALRAERAKTAPDSPDPPAPSEPA